MNIDLKNKDSLTFSSDDDIVSRVLAGEIDAYEYIIGRYKKRVFAIARHFFRQPEIVEDIAQETFTKAYFALKHYQRGASLEYWIARIAVNNCYDELRRRKSRGEFILSELTEDEAVWLENKLSQASLFGHTKKLDQKIASEISFKLLRKLNPEDQLVLVLLHIEEYSVAEIAKALNWSEAKVKIRAFRARLALRNALKRQSIAEQRKEGRETSVSPLNAI